MRAHFFWMVTLSSLLAMGWAHGQQALRPATPPLPDHVPMDMQASTFALFQEELERLQKGISFAKLVLLDTSQAAYRYYVAAGLLKEDEVSFTRLESGLAAAAVSGGTVNGNAQPVCYVLYSPDQAGSVYRSFVVPLTQAADARSAAAFLMGHEVGHCLDHFERHDMLGKKMVWQVTDLGPLGVSPDAAQRVFGPSMATGAYANHGLDLYKDNAQRQYEERVADLFGMAWVWRLGGTQAVLDALVATRSHANPWDAHATAPALLALGKEKEALARTTSVADVWALARQIQLQVGVDPSLGPGSVHALNPMAQYLDKTAPSDSSTAQPLPVPKGKNFNDLPRFGAPGDGQ